MSHILGLDLGFHSLKAVILNQAARGGQEIIWSREIHLVEEHEDRMKAWRAALTELMAVIPFKFDQAIVSLPGSSIATHVLQLPFTDAKQIEATLPFEVEGHIPFDLSEALFDYQTGSKGAQSTDLIVGVVRKEELQAFLSLLAEFQIDPRVVTHPALAYQALMPPLEGAPVAIVDIGKERINLAIGSSTALESARTFKTSPTHQGRELRQSLRSYSARSHRQIQCIYICGGTFRALPSLQSQLQEELGIVLETLPLPLSVPAPFALAYALCLRGQAGGDKISRFNLRRGEFTFKKDFEFVRSKIARAGALAAIALALFLGSEAVQSALLAARERSIDAALCGFTDKLLGQCETNFDKALNMLRGKESPSSAIPQLSAASLLNEVTQRIPNDAQVSFDLVSIDPERITLRGQTSSSKQIDSIAGSLKTFRCFQEIKEGTVEKSKDGQHVTFKLDIQVSCPERSNPG